MIWRFDFARGWSNSHVDRSLKLVILDLGLSPLIHIAARDISALFLPTTCPAREGSPKGFLLLEVEGSQAIRAPRGRILKQSLSWAAPGRWRQVFSVGWRWGERSAAQGGLKSVVIGKCACPRKRWPIANCEISASYKRLLPNGGSGAQPRHSCARARLPRLADSAAKQLVEQKPLAQNARVYYSIRLLSTMTFIAT